MTFNVGERVKLYCQDTQYFAHQFNGFVGTVVSHRSHELYCVQFSKDTIWCVPRWLKRLNYDVF